MNSDDPPKVIHEGEYIRLLQKGSWEYIQRSNCTGIVIIVALSKDGKVIFVEQYRPPVGRSVIEFPAGLVNDHPDIPNETLEEGAKRELLEETGYQAESIRHLMAGPVSAGSSADTVTMVQALDVVKVHSGGGDEGEDIVVHEIDLDQVDDWLEVKRNEGLMIEPKIYSGLYFLKSYNR